MHPPRYTRMSRLMPRGDQLSRQWRLLQMIDRPQGVTVDDAARDLECTIRTIWRDLDALQKAGFPLYTARAAPQAHPGRAGRAADEPPPAVAARPERAGSRGRLGVRQDPERAQPRRP